MFDRSSSSSLDCVMIIQLWSKISKWNAQSIRGVCFWLSFLVAYVGLFVYCVLLIALKVLGGGLVGLYGSSQYKS